MNKSKIYAGIALVLIVGFVFGVFKLLAMRNETPQVSSRTNNATADWKTYRNEKYGFEFKYPSLWGEVQFQDSHANIPDTYPYTPETGSIMDGGFTNNNRCIFGSISKDYSYPSEPPSFIFGLVDYNQTTTTTNGVRAIMGESDGKDPEQLDYGTTNSAFRVDLPNPIFNYIAFGCINFSPADKVGLDQILSTFKFIPSTSLGTGEPIDTSSWKTYRNKQYGFEVKYPGNWFISTSSNYFATRGFPFTEGDDAPTLIIKIYPAKRGEDFYRDFNVECHPSTLGELQSQECIFQEEIWLGPSGFTYIESNNVLYELSDGIATDISKQILSTFKFVNQPNVSPKSPKKCMPSFSVESGPELTASEAYAHYCTDQVSEAACLKVDIYRASTNNFGNSDGIPDCHWQ